MFPSGIIPSLSGKSGPRWSRSLFLCLFLFVWYLSSFFLPFLLSCCLTSTEARWPIRDGDREGRGRQSECSTAETVRKRPERPWTTARTMEVLRRCPLAIAQRLVHCAVAVSTAVLDRVTKTMSVVPLLTNNLDNSKQKRSNLLSPAPPPYSWSLLGKLEGPAPPPSSKISWSFDLAWNPDFATNGVSSLYRHTSVLIDTLHSIAFRQSSSSKLCQNWFCHWQSTLYSPCSTLRASLSGNNN